MPFTYSIQYREAVLARVRSGERVYAIADELSVNAATIFRWVRQDRIDRGEILGADSGELTELAVAKRRIGELERELAATKRASELYAEGRVVRPKVLYPIVERMVAEGFGAKTTCRLVGVASSGFFMWRTRPPSNRDIRRLWLTDLISKIWTESRGTYGWRRVQAELADSYDETVNFKLVRKIMRAQQISGLPKQRRYKRCRDEAYQSEDLVKRDFDRDRPNQLWMTDITEHRTSEGRVFCCVVLDAFSRRVVGWSIDARPTTVLVNTALGMAIKQRDTDHNTLIHTDHGPQYTSWAFSQQVRTAGLVQSIGTVGDAYDNAVVESFWGSMQIELLNRKKWTSRLELTSAIIDWIETFYNPTRRHSSLGYISPAEYEHRHQQPAA